MKEFWFFISGKVKDFMEHQEPMQVGASQKSQSNQSISFQSLLEQRLWRGFPSLTAANENLVLWQQCQAMLSLISCTERQLISLDPSAEKGCGSCIDWQSCTNVQFHKLWWQLTIQMGNGSNGTITPDNGLRCSVGAVFCEDCCCVQILLGEQCCRPVLLVHDFSEGVVSFWGASTTNTEKHERFVTLMSFLRTISCLRRDAKARRIASTTWFFHKAVN